MTRLRDPADDPGLLPCHPPEDEERTHGVAPGEEVEQPVDVCLHPARQTVPVAGRDQAVECIDVEVLLDVHGEEVLCPHLMPWPPH